MPALTVDREQIREGAELGHPLISGATLAEYCLDLLAELEQVEQQREDFFTKQGAALAEAAKLRRRLAKVPALVEALREVADGRKVLHAQRIAIEALAAWDSE